MVMAELLSGAAAVSRLLLLLSWMLSLGVWVPARDGVQGHSAPHAAYSAWG